MHRKLCNISRAGGGGKCPLLPSPCLRAPMGHGWMTEFKQCQYTTNKKSRYENKSIPQPVTAICAPVCTPVQINARGQGSATILKIKLFSDFPSEAYLRGRMKCETADIFTSSLQVRQRLSDFLISHVPHF